MSAVSTSGGARTAHRTPNWQLYTRLRSMLPASCTYPRRERRTRELERERERERLSREGRDARVRAAPRPGPPLGDKRRDLSGGVPAGCLSLWGAGEVGRGSLCLTRRHATSASCRRWRRRSPGSARGGPSGGPRGRSLLRSRARAVAAAPTWSPNPGCSQGCSQGAASIPNSTSQGRRP